MVNARGVSFCLKTEHTPTKQLTRIMKLFTFFMLIGCMHLSASGGAQNVNLSLKEVSLEKAFNEVRKQTGYSFVY